MRGIRLPALLAALSLAAALASGPARAQPAPARPGPAQPGGSPAVAPKPQSRASTLDELFARLAASADADEAKGIATLIERRFARSGSDTADLLMSRAGEALAEDPALAIELLDRVTQLKPDWAEAWSRRAAAFWRLDDPVDALADLNRALAQEPRNFNAWRALGHLRMAADDKKRAMEAYRKALALHPHLPDVKRAVERLAPEIDGRDL